MNLHFHEVEVVNTLNKFFSNIIRILEIGNCYVQQKFRYSLSRYQALKAILKYKNHPSIIIESFFRRFSCFYFSQVDKNSVLEYIKISLFMTSKKREYFANLNEKDIHNNRICILSNLFSPIKLNLEKIKFWKTNLHLHLHEFTFP